MTTDVYIPKPDEIVRLGVWVGVVLDVFKSETTGKHIAQIKFAKNVYKQQPAELHVLEDLSEAMQLCLVSKEDLEREVSRYEDIKRKELEALRSTQQIPA